MFIKIEGIKYTSYNLSKFMLVIAICHFFFLKDHAYNTGYIVSILPGMFVLNNFIVCIGMIVFGIWFFLGGGLSGSIEYVYYIVHECSTCMWLLGQQVHYRYLSILQVFRFFFSLCTCLLGWYDIVHIPVCIDVKIQKYLLTMFIWCVGNSRTYLKCWNFVFVYLDCIGYCMIWELGYFKRKM